MGDRLNIHNSRAKDLNINKTNKAIAVHSKTLPDTRSYSNNDIGASASILASNKHRSDVTPSSFFNPPELGGAGIVMVSRIDNAPHLLLQEKIDPLTGKPALYDFGGKREYGLKSKILASADNDPKSLTKKIIETPVADIDSVANGAREFAEETNAASFNYAKGIDMDGVADRQRNLQRAQRYYEMKIYNKPVLFVDDSSKSTNGYGTYILETPPFPTNIFPDREDVSLHNNGSLRTVAWVPLTELEKNKLSKRLQTINFYDKINNLYDTSN
jgi:hypothetical protein